MEKEFAISHLNQGHNVCVLKHDLDLGYARIKKGTELMQYGALNIADVKEPLSYWIRIGGVSVKIPLEIAKTFNEEYVDQKLPLDG